MAPTKERPATKTIATNREARHEYFVLEALETGVELKALSCSVQRCYYSVRACFGSCICQAGAGLFLVH